MKTMMFLISMTLIATNAFAGGSGGGGVLSAARNAEYVKFLGNDRGEISFEYGQVNEKKELYTQIIKMRAEEFKDQDMPILNAANVSKISKNWVQISK